jgi:hypothetical protein
MTALRWLRVQHDTVYDYDAAVELAHHVAYLAPRATEVQQVRGWTLSIDPLPDEWLALQEAHGEPVPPTTVWLCLRPSAAWTAGATSAWPSAIPACTTA